MSIDLAESLEPSRSVGGPHVRSVSLGATGIACGDPVSRSQPAAIAGQNSGNPENLSGLEPPPIVSPNEIQKFARHAVPGWQPLFPWADCPYQTRAAFMTAGLFSLGLRPTLFTAAISNNATNRFSSAQRGICPSILKTLTGDSLRRPARVEAWLALLTLRKKTESGIIEGYIAVGAFGASDSEDDRIRRKIAGVSEYASGFTRFDSLTSVRADISGFLRSLEAKRLRGIGSTMPHRPYSCTRALSIEARRLHAEALSETKRALRAVRKGKAG